MIDLSQLLEINEKIEELREAIASGDSEKRKTLASHCFVLAYYDEAKENYEKILAETNSID